MAFIVVLIPESLSICKISILLVLQTTYLNYGIMKRSFAEYKDQAIEIFNEFVFLVLLLILIQYRYESDWTDIAANAFIGIILSQICIISLVSVISGFIKLLRFIRRCRKSDSEQAQNLHSELDSFANMFVQNNNRRAEIRQIAPKQPISMRVLTRRAEAFMKDFHDEKENKKL